MLAKKNLLCALVALAQAGVIAGVLVTDSPTAAPTASPTAAPTASPTFAPTASPTAAPTSSPTAAPIAIATLDGCCREKVRDHVAPDYTAYLNHHEDRLAVKSRHYVESKKIHKPSGKVLLDTWAGMENYEWCAEQCVKSLKCISFEVAQPNMKKRFNKKRFKQPFAKCELHSYIMNEAIRKTKTCRRSTCGVLTPRAEEAAKLGLDQWRSIQTPPPTASPTAAPTASPTATPTASPTAAPTAPPTASPTAAPTASPTAAPTSAPTPAPTAVPLTSLCLFNTDGEGTADDGDGGICKLENYGALSPKGIACTLSTTCDEDPCCKLQGFN